MTNIISLSFFQMSTILTNACWPVSMSAIMINMLFGVYQYVYVFKTYDYLSLFQLTVASIMYCYAFYQQETSTRSELSRIDQVEDMNGDLNKILSEMPKSILIYNEKTETPLLAN